MELELGLALFPSKSSSLDDQGFDLNKEGLLIGSNHHIISSNVVHHVPNKKRMFCQTFFDNDDYHDNHDSQPKTLPLFSWNKQPNDEDDDPFRLLLKNSTFGLTKSDGEEDGVVGWPPIKSWRKRRCCDVGGRSENNRTVENGCSCGGRVSKFMYVKVKMEGMAIARKLDLSLHSRFETLMNTLMDMFGKCQEDLNNYKLTYQDREGDWLLAQDVSWRTFIRSVQRLKLLRR